MRVLLWMAARLVPPARRGDWLAEWTAELWYALQLSRRSALAFTCGAFRDAWWLRREHTAPARWRESPYTVLFALLTLTWAVRWLCGSYQIADSGVQLFAVLGLAGGLAAGTTLRAPIRGWTYLLIKLTLLAFIVRGSLAVLSAGRVQWPGLLVVYILVFRWAFLDQHKRCPVCWRTVQACAHIGQPSRTLLEWCGTEFVCTQGHGFLYIPQFTTSYGFPRWKALDRVWAAKAQQL